MHLVFKKRKENTLGERFAVVLPDFFDAPMFAVLLRLLPLFGCFIQDMSRHRHKKESKYFQLQYVLNKPRQKLQSIVY